MKDEAEKHIMDEKELRPFLKIKKKKEKDKFEGFKEPDWEERRWEPKSL